MFHILAPDIPAQRSLQQDEGGFYWSRCAGNWLRKQGLLAYVGVDDLPMPIVLRMAEPPHDLQGPALIEGPLSPAAAQMLGIHVEDREEESIALEPEGPLPADCLPPRLLYPGLDLETFGCARLQYPRFLVRRIPVDKNERSDPEPLSPADRRHCREKIRFQTFDLARSTGNYRPLLFAHAAEPRAGEPPRLGVVAATDGHRLALGVPLLDLFGAVAQMPPMPVAYKSSVHDLDVEWIQEWLAAAIVQLACDNGGGIVRSRRWPRGRSWALSLRVDYDRLLSDSELEAYLDLAARHSVRMSWQMLASRTIPRQAERILEAGHEIALHTEAGSLEALQAEIAHLRREAGVTVVGSTAHGGGGSMGYSGDIRFGWSEALGLEHCEMISHGSLTAYRLNRIVDDLPEPSSLICPAPHRGLDYGMKPEQHMLARYRERDVPAVRTYGGHFPLMHHPDIHCREMATLLDSIDWSGCWHATLTETARWARDLHYNATVEGDGKDGLHVRIPCPLGNDAVIEWFTSSGAAATVLTAGTTQARLA